MKEMRCHAFVLRVRSLGEADKLVTLLTREAGKVTAVARGSRKTKSKFSALVEPLILGKFLLHRGKTLYTFIQGELVKSYGELHKDLERLAYAQYFCELCERSLPEEEPSEAIFFLLLTALQALEQDPQPARVARCFELSLLDELGLRPAVENCSGCGSTSDLFRFDPAVGSLLCVSCPHSTDSIPVSAAAVAIMKRLLELGFHKLSICSIPPEASREIQQVGAAILDDALGINKLKSLTFLQQTGYL